ncbi:MAG: hypothetical protein ABIE74_01625, partial [Pseudomonadota bacterium]
MKKIVLYSIVIFCAFALSSCSKGSSPQGEDPNYSGYPNTAFTIFSEKDLIGGPTAIGKIGDLLLENDQIRVIIEKPIKNSFLNSFGGIIVDADLVRKNTNGNDNFGSIFPMINIEWTVNYNNYEVLANRDEDGTKVVRAYGIIDVYDYLDLDFIGAIAKGFAGQDITFSNRFDDRMNPFDIYDDLRGMDTNVTTDYILEPGKNYVKVETTLTNNGDKDVRMPVGLFINNSGQNSLLIPGTGFSPGFMKQAGGNTSAVIFPAFDDVDVSYGVFFDQNQFLSSPDDKGEKTEAPKSASITYSGFTVLAWGEELLKLLPLGGGTEPKINFTIPA